MAFQETQVNVKAQGSLVIYLQSQQRKQADKIKSIYQIHI